MVVTYSSAVALVSCDLADVLELPMEDDIGVENDLSSRMDEYEGSLTVRRIGWRLPLHLCGVESQQVEDGQL